MISMQKIMKHALLILPILILMLASLNVPLVRSTGMAVNWTGAGGDGKWETAANWAFGQVPGADDLVSISSPVTVTISSPAQVSTLLLQKQAVLNCNSRCSLSTGITNYGTVNNYGFINDLLGGAIENYGTINNYGTIINNHVSTNSGTIINNYGGTITNNGGMTNSGIITNRCGGTILGSGATTGSSVNALKC
jgi:hypothetical protein